MPHGVFSAPFQSRLQSLLVVTASWTPEQPPAQPTSSCLCTLCRKLQGLWSLDTKSLLPGSTPQVTRGLAVINQAWDPNPTGQEASLLSHAPLCLSLGGPLSRLCAPFNPLPSSSAASNAHQSPVELFLHTRPRKRKHVHTDWQTNAHSIWYHQCPKLETIHVPITWCMDGYHEARLYNWSCSGIKKNKQLMLSRRWTSKALRWVKEKSMGPNDSI